MNTNDFSAWLIELLDRYDPMDLLHDLNPGREYKPEARAILKALPYAHSLDEVSAAVHAVFVHYFGEDLAGPQERYTDIALQIQARRH